MMFVDNSQYGHERSIEFERKLTALYPGDVTSVFKLATRKQLTSSL